MCDVYIKNTLHKAKASLLTWVGYQPTTTIIGAFLENDI